MPINLINGNSINELKKFPNRYFDICITDPPYGVGYHEYDKPEALFELENELYRVLKDNAWLVFFWSIKTLPKAFQLKKFKYKWMMICNYPRTFSKTPVGDRTYTPILIFQKGNPKVIYRRSDNVLAEELPLIKGKVKSGDFKPTFALSQLVLMFSKDTDKILDPFMGYGSLALVCKLFNRDFTGIEILKERFKIAKKITNEGQINKSIPDMLNENKERQTKLKSN